MVVPNKERVNHQGFDQHEASLNPVASTRSGRSGGRHLLERERNDRKPFIVIVETF